MTRPRSLVSLIARARQIDRPLTDTSLLMLAVLVATGIGLLVDTRIVTGAPVWLKPAKFAASIAIFGFTMVWIFSYLPEWPRLRRRVGSISAAVFLIEMAIIALQAARGISSHFNVSSVLNTTLFAVMGTAIVIQTIATAAVAAALFRQPFADRALGWTLRLGVVISLAGSATGGLMTRPTSAQLAAAHTTHQMTTAGAHTVGAPDGGPGMPGTGWSAEHGDIRVAHFFGLHAMQALPMVLFILPAAWTERRRTRVIVAGAASYSALFAVLLWQALRGESLVQPGALTLSVLIAWAVLSTIATGAATINAAGARRPALSF